MCLLRLGCLRHDARFFHLVGLGISTVRLVSSFQFQKFVQTIFHVFDLGTEIVRHHVHEQSRVAFLIGRSVHQAQLSVSFEAVVSSFLYDFPCFFLCVSIVRRYSNVADCCSCGGVAITSVGECLAAFSRAEKAGSSVPACSLNVKSQSSKSLSRAHGSGFPTLMSSGRARF